MLLSVRFRGLGNSLDGLASQLLIARANCQIAKRNKSDQLFIPIENWQTAHLLLFHELNCLLYVLIIEAADYFCRHDLTGASFPRLQTFGSRADGDIAITKHSHYPV